ncbi:dynamin family protein [Streptomyces sp. NPDC002668]|uniref:dynamin family protein n=1 Tax=Streptomyces sp. NPDC002668 TaxID=3154422 RepID=UPI00331E0BF7
MSGTKAGAGRWRRRAPSVPDRLRKDSLALLERGHALARDVEGEAEGGGSDTTPLRFDLSEVINLWSARTPQVLLLGAYSSGKTSLMVRLLGLDWLPVAKTPTTAVPTEFRFGSRPRGLLRFRTQVRVALPLETEHRARSNAKALADWLRSPDDLGVQEVYELTGGDRTPVRGPDLLAELDQQLEGRSEQPLPARTFELRLRPREPAVFDLAEPDAFARHLTDPGLAPLLQKATCEIPRPGLRRLSFLDTAGLCSPVPLHAEVYAELVRHTPDAIVVLLDARRPDSYTNNAALEALRRFVREPDDYRRVTFAFTSWDREVKRFMSAEDYSTGPERDFASRPQREAAAAERITELRDQLRDLLADVVGVPPPGEPATAFLALAPSVPEEMRGGPRDLCLRLEEDFAGELGARMWRDRWQAAVDFGPRLHEAHRQAYEDAGLRLELSADDTNREHEARRIVRERQQLRVAVERCSWSLDRIVRSLERAMLADIAALRTKKSVLQYVEEGYAQATAAALTALADTAAEQRRAIVELCPEAAALEPIVVDARLLALDHATRNRVLALFTGAGYRLKAASDAILSGIPELTTAAREAAREELRGHLGSVTDILSRTAREWVARARLAEGQALARWERRAQVLTADRAEAARLRTALRERLTHLERLEPEVAAFARDIEEFVTGRGAAAGTAAGAAAGRSGPEPAGVTRWSRRLGPAWLGVWQRLAVRGPDRPHGE